MAGVETTFLLVQNSKTRGSQGGISYSSVCRSSERDGPLPVESKTYRQPPQQKAERKCCNILTAVFTRQERKPNSSSQCHQMTRKWHMEM